MANGRPGRPAKYTPEFKRSAVGYYNQRRPPLDHRLRDPRQEDGGVLREARRHVLAPAADGGVIQGRSLSEKLKQIK